MSIGAVRKGDQKQKVSFLVCLITAITNEDIIADSRAICSQNSVRRDSDPKRMQAFAAIRSKSKVEVFDDVYGPRQIHLQILATHPKHQRRGAGRALCDWGIRLAERIAAPITVFASLMGNLLYQRIGFITVDKIKIQVVDDEHEGVVLTAMTLIPQSFASALKWRQAAWDQSTTSDEECDWKWR
jgi:ribosomal protein S18 acetylase RimI-like enzyme